MNNLFEGKNVVIQGITGTHGSFQAAAMIKAGTHIIAGVTPGKGGEVVENVPVYNTVAEAQKNHLIDISVVFVPARFAKAALLEAIKANIPLIVCITEGIPVHDMLEVNDTLKASTSILLGPNSPGALIPGGNKLGIIPAHMGFEGSVAIVSRSGTLTYETMASLTEKKIGQRYVIGIGGDTIHGLGYIECLRLFEDDPLVKKIVLIGEIGGQDEVAAAAYIKKHISKPVFAYIAGHSAPKGVQLGHAGAILGSERESAQAKTAILAESGAQTAISISGLISLISSE